MPKFLVDGHVKYYDFLNNYRSYFELNSIKISKIHLDFYSEIHFLQ